MALYEDVSVLDMHNDLMCEMLHKEERPECLQLQLQERGQIGHSEYSRTPEYDPR